MWEPTRRRFIQHLSAAAGAGLCVGLGSGRRARAAPTKSRVVTVTDGRAWKGPGWGDTDLDHDRLVDMLAVGLCELTQKKRAAEALATLIPTIADPTQRFGVKVNCVSDVLPSHPKVASALAQLLIAAGAVADKITVFDRRDEELSSCGYTLGAGERLRVMGTDHEGVGYEETGPQTSAGEVRLSRMVTAHSDHLINLPVLKNHEMAGITLALKNHFGSILDPMAQHGPDNDGCPGISEIAALAEIRERTRLVLIDATFGTFEAGLSGDPEFAPMSLILATDPVAADAVGQALINTRRQKAGLSPIHARHLAQAAAAGLGQAAADQIEHRVVELSPVVEKPHPGPGGCAAVDARAVSAVGAAAVLSGLCRQG